MGSCVSSFSQKKTKKDTGISSATYSQTTNKKPVNSRFHENDNVASNKARKAKVVKRQKTKINKGLISLPSNFQHTGHIGITELRSGKVDPEKIKSQMAEVAASLNLEGLNIGSSPTPTVPINNGINNQVQQIITDNNNSNNSNNSNRPTSQNDFQFKVKRKPTLTQISSPVQQQQNSPIVDPMAEIVAALRMPIDENFDKQNDQKLVI